jgi:hypothetical protein
MPATLPSPAPTSQFGFTCKTWIASQLDQIHLGGTYYVWFSTELNPMSNGDSSIPLEIYREIDTAVKKRDANHPKLESVKRNSLLTVSRLIAPMDRARARASRREIRTASLEMFRPQIWRIDLRKVDASRWKKDRSHPGWDEQYVTDLKATEFDILVE